MKRRNEVTVGILITVAVTVLILGTLWLVRGGLKSGYPLYTRFQWGQNLKQGQPVLLAGVSVGYVGDVNLRRDGFLDVMLQIDNQYAVPKGSKAVVKAVGIFGDVAVALIPPIPPPPQSYNAGDTVPPGPPSADVTEIMNRADSISIQVSTLLGAMQQQVIQAGTLNEMHRTLANMAALTGQMQRVLVEQNRNMTQTMGALRDAATHASNLLDSADIRATMANLKTASANSARLTADLDSTNTAIRGLLTQAQHGNGTVGKLLSDSLLYTDMRRLLVQTDSLLADFKNNPKKYINLRIF